MMMRWIFIVTCFFGLLLGSFPAVAQKKSSGETKSYESYKFRKDADVSGLLDEARLLKDTDPKEALNKVEEALGISLAQGDVAQEAKCYILLGEINESVQEWKLALEYFTSAYEKLRQPEKSKVKRSSSSIDLRFAARGIGNANLRLANYQASLQYFQEALSLATNAMERAERQLDISEVYYHMGDYGNALQTVEAIVEGKIANESLSIKIQNQKAKIYAQTNQLDKARDAYELSQNTLRSNRAPVEKNDEQSLNDAGKQVAEELHAQQRYDEEIDFRNKSIEYNLETKNLAEVTEDKLGLGKALAAKGDVSEAIRELEEAAYIADSLNNPREQAKAFLAIADLYEKNNQSVNAIEAYKKYSNAVSRYEEQNKALLTERAELLKKQRDIEELTKDVSIGKQEEAIARQTVIRQRIIIYGLLFVIIVIIVTSYFIYKNAQASKIANQLLALKSLRSQMNPHFIFNALNSVNHFVAQNDERTANKFLSEFSRLMRLVLENSQLDFIPLLKEQEIISLYLKLEHYRFRDKFDYEFCIEDDINMETVEIPPMLVQPYIENAVWHGLRYKETKGHLSVHIGRNTNSLQIIISDNGIGRKKSADLKTENQKKQNSTGLKNIQERLKIINRVYKVHYAIDVSDLNSDGTGTRVTIHLPARQIKY